jgi:amidophosphoribosyltransferase
MCGVVGIKFFKEDRDAIELGVKTLLRLQHRGQDGAGIAAFSKKEGTLESLRGLGLIDVALREWSTMDRSEAMIAHTRYATTGTGGISELQPFLEGAPKVAMAHNGNIVNTEELRRDFGIPLVVDSDLEVLQQIFLKLRQDYSFEETLTKIMATFVGSYAVVGLEESGEFFAFRDPHGIRPLFMATCEDFIAVASETSALTPLQNLTPPGTLKISEILPGQWIRTVFGSVQSGMIKLDYPSRKAFCMFELVYFSSPQSEYADRSVYRQRFSLGKQLAWEISEGLSGEARRHFDYVVPVPETSRTAAIAVAEILGVPYREYLVKNPYVPRTFILGRQDARLKALEAKLSLIGPEIQGQKILLVDDSVVRGNTSRLMALRLREAGAKSVAMASTCPPIRHGCFYGIDFPDPQELVASGGRTVLEIQTQLGVDSLYYLTIPGLKKALGREDLCMACLDGDYPARNRSFDEFLQKRRAERLPTVLGAS